MSEAKKKDILSWVCIGLGTVFVLAGIVLFIMSNYMNLQMRKIEATVVGMYDLVQETGLKHTMVDLSYKVGDKVIFANYEYPGVLPEDTVILEVYYNIKQPDMILEGGWSFEPLLVFALGALTLISGLFFKGIIKADAFKLVEPSGDANKTAKQLYDAKRRVFEGLLPMIAGILFTAFGIIMLIINHNWWAWMFIVVGGIELLYIGMDFIPAVVIWSKINKINNIKGKAKVYDVEMNESDVADEDNAKSSPKDKSIKKKK